MSVLWHGYIALVKPTAVSAGDWATALAALKTALDEMPTAGQPCERWHTATSGSTTIAEAIFDTSKLNTPYLSGVTGFDMTGAWEVERVNQSWERSRLAAHSLIKDRSWVINAYTVYTPASASMAHVQAAIDAAEASGSGIVDCTGLTVNITKGGTLDCELSGDMDYGLWVDCNNVWIRGGIFQVAAAPDSTHFAAIVFGNGGAANGKPGNTGTWRYGNRIIGSTINATALTPAERSAAGHGIAGCAVLFTYCQDFQAVGVTVADFWNHGILTNVSSRYGLIVDCSISNLIVYTGIAAAVALDGAHFVTVANCETHTRGGVVINANLDNCVFGTDTTGYAEDNFIIGNDFLDIGSAVGPLAGMGISLNGANRTVIDGNVFENNPEDAWTFEGVAIVPFCRNVDGSAASDDTAIRGNTFTSTGISSVIPVKQGGVGDPNNGGYMNVSGTRISSNTQTRFTRRGWFVNAYVDGSVFSGNTYDEYATIYGYSSAGDQTAIEANNTLQ